MRSGMHKMFVSPEPTLTERIRDTLAEYDVLRDFKQVGALQRKGATCVRYAAGSTCRLEYEWRHELNVLSLEDDFDGPEDGSKYFEEKHFRLVEERGLILQLDLLDDGNISGISTSLSIDELHQLLGTNADEGQDALPVIRKIIAYYKNRNL